ncbi:MAG: hypothetical protein HN705_05560 [Rhodospirillales bacterium]|nr:hypothetical protein [Rhodospirillales bacterium]
MAQAWLYFHHGDLDLAIERCQSVFAANPNWAAAYQELGSFLLRAQRFEEALKYMDIADRLNPTDPRLSGRQTIRAASHFGLGQYEDCVSWTRKVQHSQYPRIWVHVLQLAALQKLGDGPGVISTKRALLQQWPDVSMSRIRPNKTYQISGLLEALQQVGLPD